MVWFDFDPQAGHEQAGRRPALVLSSRQFNLRANLAFVCPITGKIKGYASEVPLPPGLPVYGVVLCSHMRSLDWQARNAVLIGKAPDDVLLEVREIVGSIAGITP
ncbi:MAG: type II toxin-antitoxin system PemK/MazF family toxin [Terracidiphilus sp.]